MVRDIAKKENSKKISDYWKGKKVAVTKRADELENPSSLQNSVEGKEQKKNSFLKSLLHPLKNRKNKDIPQEGGLKQKTETENKKKKEIFSKEQVQEMLGKEYENRQGNQEVIRVENVIKDFTVGDTVMNILKDVGFTVNQGEFVMLVGPSGCGKSTLLHSIYGLEEPTSGRIWIDGLDIWNESKNWRADFRNRNIGFIPQQAFWIKSFSVLENIAIPATINGESFASALERAAKLIQLIQMEHRSSNRPYDLSGGEQQRIAMARALLLNPKFIIADEPTGNLDQKSGEELMDLFKEFNDRFNITILMVTHNPDQYKYCTKLVKMVDGKIVENKVTRKKS
jgi:putative ABC transport system ATP-binding protein